MGLFFHFSTDFNQKIAKCYFDGGGAPNGGFVDFTKELKKSTCLLSVIAWQINNPALIEAIG